MEKKAQKFLEALNDIMTSNGPYKDKIDIIRDECNDSDKTNLKELKSWLEEMFPEED